MTLRGCVRLLCNLQMRFSSSSLVFKELQEQSALEIIKGLHLYPQLGCTIHLSV